ncbi:hypothetical protein [Amycolatopsis sp. SID8362]|uniref:hypothetical protein n=1 Tax=Amycolatopsis sp. SID8362 TaxID=2690346 RepID=UPI0013680012|nr:hypothetical protein [Amycolatopsis sp. SID8362]NBH12552.1 hypothetical protein [Amycolatopsis sp. SID8362]NED49244.1 hypothetical protein [Amycolatopsis sp. SID8362]
MSSPETSWNTRLAVRYTDDKGADHEISPIQSFTPTFATTAEPLHSIERTHVGVVVQPYSLTFSLTVNAIGPATAQLTALALNATEFSISMQERSGDDWSFSTIVLSRCVITSAAPTAATVAGAPQATFSGFSMHVDATDAGGAKTSGPLQSAL